MSIFDGIIHPFGVVLFQILTGENVSETVVANLRNMLNPNEEARTEGFRRALDPRLPNVDDTTIKEAMKVVEVALRCVDYFNLLLFSERSFRCTKTTLASHFLSNFHFNACLVVLISDLDYWTKKESFYRGHEPAPQGADEIVFKESGPFFQQIPSALRLTDKLFGYYTRQECLKFFIFSQTKRVTLTTCSSWIRYPTNPSYLGYLVF